MHEEIPGARADGHGHCSTTLDVYGAEVDVVAVRRAIGMVFQKPNPFPTMSIFDNVAAGLRLTRHGAATSRERVEQSLRGAGLWDEVKDRLGEPGHRALRRPAAAPVHRAHDRGRARGDPHGRAVLGAGPDRDAEDRGARSHELKQRYTIVIVTHNMQQAARVADTTAFMLDGELVELGADREDLHQPRRRADRGVRHREVRVAAWPRARTPALPARSSSALEDAGARRARHGRRPARPRARGARAPGRRARRDRRSPTTTASTAATSRSTRGSCRCSRCQAPVAGDLRLVAALLHVIKHVERMGDQCVNIAKLIPLAGHEPPTDEEMLEHDRRDGPAGALAGRAGQAGVRRPRRRRWPRTSCARTRDQPAQPRVLPPRDRDRRRPRPARVGDDDDAGRARARARSATTPSTSASRSRSSSPGCSASSPTPRTPRRSSASTASAPAPPAGRRGARSGG